MYLPHDPAIPLFYQENGNICPSKDKNAHDSFIHKLFQLEAIQMSNVSIRIQKPHSNLTKEILMLKSNTSRGETMKV